MFSRYTIKWPVCLLCIAISTAPNLEVKAAFVPHIQKSCSENYSQSSVIRRPESSCRLNVVEDSTLNIESSEDKDEKKLSRTEHVATARFHDDMRRVLQSRKHFREELVEASLERRSKPIVLQSDVDGAERVLAMLDHLQKIGAANEESFQIAMEAFLARGRLRWHNDTVVVCAADQIEVLLEDLLRIIPSNSVSMKTYNLVLEAYALCSTPRGDRDYARRAASLLRRIEAMFLDIPTDSLMHVVHAYSWQQANMRDGDCAKKANALLDRIVDQTDDPSTLMKCYAFVLEAWSKSGSPGSVEKADGIFQKMKQLVQAQAGSMGGDKLHLDAEVYSNAILAWSKSSEVESAEKAQSLLVQMIDSHRKGTLLPGSNPTLIAFNGVISSWARLGHADNAEKVLWLMDKVRLDCKTLIPDAISYNSVLYAHMKTSRKDKALENALRLVNYMEENCCEQPAIKPNAFTYNTLMKCWIQSRRPELASEAELLLQKMEKLWRDGDRSLEPNNRIYNMVINAHAKSSDGLASQKAEDLLNRMKASQKCQPDIISYTSVMECLSKSADPTAPNRAEALLQEAFERYDKSKEPSLMPNLRTFTMAILTFARNNGSVTRARALLDQLLQLYDTTQDPQLLPNEYPYNYVLSCAANALEDKNSAFQIATKTYQDMRKSDIVKPDSYTYAFWLKCCNNLLPDGDLRHKCVSYAFDECKKDGLVSNEVLTRLFQGNAPDLVNELLELSRTQGPRGKRIPYRSMTTKDLPPSWSRRA